MPRERLVLSLSLPQEQKTPPPPGVVLLDPVLLVPIILVRVTSSWVMVDGDVVLGVMGGGGRGDILPGVLGGRGNILGVVGGRGDILGVVGGRGDILPGAVSGAIPGGSVVSTSSNVLPSPGPRRLPLEPTWRVSHGFVPVFVLVRGPVFFGLVFGRVTSFSSSHTHMEHWQESRSNTAGLLQVTRPRK